jgi:hypothetical protein
VPGALAQGLKRHGREADNSSPSSAEVKNVGTILPLLICLHAIGLNYKIKYMDNFTFILFITIRDSIMLYNINDIF